MCAGAGPDPGFRTSVVRGEVVRVQWTPGLRITGSLAAAAMAAVDQLNGDRGRPLLVAMAGAGTPTREAREQWGQQCTATRVALLGQSVVDRVHASFGPGIGGLGHRVPTRYFTSEDDALAWLLAETPAP